METCFLLKIHSIYNKIILYCPFWVFHCHVSYFPSIVCLDKNNLKTFLFYILYFCSGFVNMESLINHQSQLISLYGSLFRNGNIELFMKSLQKIIYDLRQVVMTTKNAHVQQAHFDVLKLVYKLIPYCRDIYGGLGERQLSYAMLFVWKYLFPVPTAQCFYKMVMPMDGNPPFGSLRDVKGLCSHVRKYSELKEKDPFI